TAAASRPMSGTSAVALTQAPRRCDQRSILPAGSTTAFAAADTAGVLRGQTSMPDILTAKALREKRAPLAQRIQELRDTIHKEDRDFTSEERANWEQVNKDYDALTLKIQIAERAESVEVEQRRRTGDGQPGRDDFNGQQTRRQTAQKGAEARWLAGDGHYRGGPLPGPARLDARPDRPRAAHRASGSPGQVRPEP